MRFEAIEIEGDIYLLDHSSGQAAPFGSMDCALATKEACDAKSEPYATRFFESLAGRRPFTREIKLAEL